MMNRYCLLGFIIFAAALPVVAQQDSTNKGSDATQSFVSPLGLGTGATLSVTQKGTTVAASAERQMINPIINFWQVGANGTTDKNGQLAVFSSSDKDAPGFKAKLGFGHSSFIKMWQEYTGTGGAFIGQAWCRDIAGAINRTLRAPATIPAAASCKDAVGLVKLALHDTPPVDNSGHIDVKAQDLDQKVLDQLDMVSSTITIPERTAVCNLVKDVESFYLFCPASGKPQKSVEDQHKVYPALYNIVTGQPSAFQWKVSGSWAPTMTSVAYRSVNNGVPDLADPQQWTHLLNTGVIDLALYRGRIAFGVEGGFGKTVNIKTQNICNTLTSGTFTAQQCDTAMVGRPNPSNSWTSSSALAVNPLPLFSSGTLFNPGAEVTFSYEVPTKGGHKSELAIPFYLAPSSSPMAFVFGIQPTWDWNTDPKVGNKFYVSLFVGARPEVAK
jgi:hypothetical protein